MVRQARPLRWPVETPPRDHQPPGEATVPAPVDPPAQSLVGTLAVMACVIACLILRNL